MEARHEAGERQDRLVFTGDAPATAPYPAAGADPAAHRREDEVVPDPAHASRDGAEPAELDAGPDHDPGTGRDVTSTGDTAVHDAPGTGADLRTDVRDGTGAAPHGEPGDGGSRREAAEVREHDTGRDAGWDAEGTQRRWREIQAAFVDDPRDAVEQAHSLVDEAIGSLTARQRELSGRWKDTETDDTERLRVALRDYRSLLERLTGPFSSAGRK